VLADLASDPALRREAGAKARAFMVERWNDAKVAMKLADFYTAVS
jgi:hypothetical protein